jgi:hypothetical protein
VQEPLDAGRAHPDADAVVFRVAEEVVKKVASVSVRGLM